MNALALLALALASPEAAVDPCAAPVSERAPDPRCGETLDGRAAAEPSAARKVGQAALFVPRVATQVAFWPLVRSADVVESNHVFDWAHALLTTDDGRVGVRPELQYSTSFLPTGGLRLFYRRLPGEGSEVMVRGRTGGPSIWLGQVGIAAPRLGLSLLATYDRRNDRLYAGVGPQTDEELASAGQGVARYASENVGAELRWARRLPWRLVAQAHGDVQRRDYRASDVKGHVSVSDLYGLAPDECAAQGLAVPCVDESQMPGFNRGLRIAQLGGGVGLDLRDPARDGDGFSLVTDATIARGVGGDPSRHALLSAEAIAALGGGDRLVLLRARAAMIERLASAPIPFDQPVIPFDMRGFPAGRFRGESGLTGTIEYRWFISGSFDAALFTDVGTVAGPRFAGIDWERWFPSFGLGFRYYKPQGAYWEARALDGIQIAYAPQGGFRVLFNMAAF